jgi:hypothetical protein
MPFNSKTPLPPTPKLSAKPIVGPPVYRPETGQPKGAAPPVYRPQMSAQPKGVAPPVYRIPPVPTVRPPAAMVAQRQPLPSPPAPKPFRVPGPMHLSGSQTPRIGRPLAPGTPLPPPAVQGMASIQRSKGTKGGNYFTQSKDQKAAERRRNAEEDLGKARGHGSRGPGKDAGMNRATTDDEARIVEHMRNQEAAEHEAKLKDRANALDEVREEKQANRAAAKEAKNNTQLKLMAHKLHNNVLASALSSYQRQILTEYCQTYGLSTKDQKNSERLDLNEVLLYQSEIMNFVTREL